MPAANPQTIVDALLSAFEESGGYAHFDKATLRRNPRKFKAVTDKNETFSIWIYVWTLTHGGRTNLPDEYRIQMTGVSSPLMLNDEPFGKTVLLGYEPSLDAFAGFDIRLHRTFTQGSPSVQININTLKQALTIGLSIDHKSNDEIAVGFRGDNFLNYVQNAELLHGQNIDIDTVQTISNLGEIESQTDYVERLAEYEAGQTSAVRRKVVSEVSRLTRNSNFREKVLRAYDRKCAITGIQLTLPEAAHILPVTAPDSTDSVTNGLLLSPTYHKAFDKGIIYIDENYIMRPNAEKIALLRAINLHSGLDYFLQSLGRLILPVDMRAWPDQTFIRRANEFRGIA